MRALALAMVVALTAGCQDPFHGFGGGSHTHSTSIGPSLSAHSRGGRIAGSILLAFVGVVLVGAAATDELSHDDGTKPDVAGRIGFGALGVGLVGLAYLVWPPSASTSAPAAPAAPAEPPLPERLDRAMVAAGVAPVRQLADDCAASGEIRASVTVSPDGTVVDVRVAPSTDAGVATCVANVLRSARFEPTRSGGSFAMPFKRTAP